MLLKYIEQIHAGSRGTYGSPRVHAELTLGLGMPVNLKRVERLMREAGIQGLYRRRRHATTVRDPAGNPSADLVNRRFTADTPDRLWITDITEHPTAEGRIYCAAVMDTYSRLVIGWSIADHMRTELVTDALGMAILRRQPDDGNNHPAFRPRLAIHVMGIRATPPRRRIARVDGHRGRLLRQWCATNVEGDGRGVERDLFP